ncbi:PREDICTED: pentatricopeptide repeat-containing protein At5g66520 [Theobroma cacao]|uniref:Pentatricopeptide repeat-containing protein At5g66520 n=1 Tax=Theobroma cacao TaxID=3641 RepID=A0AB32VCW7_THECC|nr:PREDICTED: pentatricopeptide repeat-containing protein At5g66520 [Theobroma cacao]
MLKVSASDRQLTAHLAAPSKDSKQPEKLTSNKPNHLQILKKCTHLIQFKQVHAQIIKTTLPQADTHLSKLIQALVGSAHLPYARLVLDQITEPSTFAFNTMIKGYGTNNLGDKGIDLYIQMRYRGLNPDNFTYPFLLKACHGLKQGKGVHSLVVKNKRFSSEIHFLTSLITFYCSVGDVESARLLFDRMPEKNVVTWTGIIKGYVKQKRYKEGIQLFYQMRNSGVEINELTLVCVLSACANLGALEIGKWVHEYTDRKKIFLNPKLGAALIDMYAKCGHIDKASQVFQTVPCKGVYVWNAMIGGLAMHGYGIEAIDRFMEMQGFGIKPDGITLIAVLSACSHSGLVVKGKEIFQSMRKVYEIEPTIKHYGCFVDLLCRAELLNEAYEIIINMPMEPNGVLWGTLLNACTATANIELAEAAMEQLMVLEPFNDGNYVLTSNIYAAKKRWDDVARIRKVLKHKQIVRNPGHSLIEVHNVVHEFMVGDGRHPCSEEIYDMLEKVAITLKE